MDPVLSDAEIEELLGWTVDPCSVEWGPRGSRAPQPRFSEKQAIGPPDEPPAEPPTAHGWRVVLSDPARSTTVRAFDEYLSQAEQAQLFSLCSALPFWVFDKPSARGLQRRGICMLGLPGVAGYRYSGQTVFASPMDDTLGALLDRVNAELGTNFNSWLLNWYRPREWLRAPFIFSSRSDRKLCAKHASEATGLGPWPRLPPVETVKTRWVRKSPGDCLGPHSDDERDLARSPDGGLCVFGLTLTNDPECRRVLRFDSKAEPHRRAELVTAAGQAYVMEGDCQKHYTHEVPKAVLTRGSRISLTARTFR